jgi:UDP:flavonoid glycosyltransferase YjiC (YdhE family)
MFKIIDWKYADPVLAGPINAFRAELGLTAVSGIIKDWWMSPERVIGLWPDWYAAPQPDWPAQLKLTGFPLYDERGFEALAPKLIEFLDGGDAPIAFTFGSAMTQAREYFAAAADACQRLGRRGILLTRHRQQVPTNLPAGVRHFDYAPFSELLPRCAALVHHGGVGTTAQGLAAGVPQLITPFAHDQHDNAARVKRLGVGAELAPSSFRGGKVAKVLGRLLGDAEMPARCRAVALKFGGVDPLGETCEWIESLVSESAGVERSERGESPSPILS